MTNYEGWSLWISGAAFFVSLLSAGFTLWLKIRSDKRDEERNAWENKSREERVNLKLDFGKSIGPKQSTYDLAFITLVNQSAFPITVETMELVFENGFKLLAQFGQKIPPFIEKFITEVAAKTLAEIALRG